MRVGAFLRCHAIPEYQYDLAVEERKLKTEMLRAYRSQSRTLAPFFGPARENFRRAPAYDFLRPPHSGKLFYEYFDWGVSGKTWRKLCAGSLAQMGLRRNGL
jgi:N-acetylglucosamine malate deacetylase 2